jgi:hypothetical protein
LLRVLGTTGSFCRSAGDRELVAEQVRLVLEAGDAGIRQPADLVPVRAHGERVLRELTG